MEELRIDLLDRDRQSLGLSLGRHECRLWVFWQPSDGNWYANLNIWGERVVSGVRLTNNALILPVGHVGLDGGNIRMIPASKADGLHEATRAAWSRPTHRLVYETP